MGREVRRVPATWEHPTDAKGHYIPLFKAFPYNAEEIAEGVRDGWLQDIPPHYGCAVMPDWPLEDRTHWQMYEDVSEGTPISPPLATPEALAHWLAEHNASASGGMTATEAQWLAMIRQEWAVSMVWDGHTMTSGVAYEAQLSQEEHP